MCLGFILHGGGWRPLGSEGCECPSSHPTLAEPACGEGEQGLVGCWVGVRVQAPMWISVDTLEGSWGTPLLPTPPSVSPPSWGRLEIQPPLGLCDGGRVGASYLYLWCFFLSHIIIVWKFAVLLGCLLLICCLRVQAFLFFLFHVHWCFWVPTSQPLIQDISSLKKKPRENITMSFLGPQSQQPVCLSLASQSLPMSVFSMISRLRSSPWQEEWGEVHLLHLAWNRSTKCLSFNKVKNIKQWSLFEENYSHFLIVWTCKCFPRYIISSSPGLKKKLKIWFNCCFHRFPIRPWRQVEASLHLWWLLGLQSEWVLSSPLGWKNCLEFFSVESDLFH